MKTYIFDWKRTLYNPEKRVLIDGAVELLNYLAYGNRLVLVGKGDDGMRAETERLDVTQFFADIQFVEGEKDAVMFSALIDKAHPERTIVIGDRTRSELAVGNLLGARTIWVRQGKFRNELPEAPVFAPDYTVGSLSEVLAIVREFR